MKKYLLFLLFLSNVSYAQVVGSQPDPYATYTQSQNLLSPTVNAWTGTVAGQNGGFAGGTTPAFNPGTNTIIFGYTVASATQTIGINAALATAGTGLKIGGYSYSWNINNDSSSGQYGTLSSTVSLRDTSGAILQSYTSNYPQMIGMGFINYSGTQWFPQDYPLSSVTDLELKFTGKDAKFWAGYYGPQVRMPSIMLEYTQDLCQSNPLSSPSCPGYAAAYQTQQCSINPLFDPSCPGYTLAQCNINPLSSQICPGYQAAYLAQQCSLNSLYDSSCPGYATAYFNQQCSLNPLYDRSCSGYASAYAKQNLQNSSSSNTNTTSSTVVSKTEPLTTIKTDGTVQTSVSKTGDSTVDSVIENKTTSASPSETTAAVKLTPSGTQNVSSQAITSPQQTTEKSETKTSSSQSQQSSQRTTARNERTESKSEANESKSNSEVKQAREKKAKEEMRKAEQATSFEGQVAVQANVISAMSFVPGFSSYAQSNIPDILEKQIKKQYGKDVIDNRQAGRRLFGAADRLHQEMVDGQYK